MEKFSGKLCEEIEILYALPLEIYTRVNNGFLYFDRRQPRENLNVCNSVVVECPKDAFFILFFRKVSKVPKSFVALDIGDFFAVKQTPPLTRNYQFSSYCEAVVFLKAFEFLSKFFETNFQIVL